ncbi:protein aurora borealis-like isoform X2 [Stegodyphus dumicola]|nr:protein aurora borealis-like isoform X2 [Stegodyphus dumicola]
MENKKQFRKSPATPASNVLTFDNTPKRGWASQNYASPLMKLEEMDQEKLKTQSPAVPKNPFDVKAESLYFHSCSPSVFATFSRNKTNDGKVGWSVEHLSLLYPADIDETSTQDPWEDTDQEVKAQQAIDAFFSQNSVVPSPWSETPEGTDENKLRRNVRRFCSFQNVLSCDVETQTNLTIPPDVDLMALLGDRFIYDEYSCSRESSCCETDVLSNSSLRRKLFVADEDFSSPLGDEKKHLSLTRRSTSSIHMRSMHSTPASCQCANTV